VAAIAPGSDAEDSALHVRIDVFRDLFKDDNRPVEAERNLRNLLESGALEKAPRANFRVLTNLGSIALHLGREAEAIDRYEAAYAARPEEAHAIANLAFVRVLQGRFDEAMAFAREALKATPPAEHAVGYLLQAAARSNWQGDPDTLVPDNLRGGLHADLGLAELYRRREKPGWQAQCLELAGRHPDASEFIQVRAIALLSLAIDVGNAQVGGMSPVSGDDLFRVAGEMKAFTERLLESGFAHEHDRSAHLNNTAALLRLSGRDAEVVEC
jgi:tetratricopeptide (TPR) repeat protein